MAFAKFMAGFFGRALRVIIGLALIWWGVSMSSTVGTIIAIIGVVAALAGLFNFCLAAPLFGAPISGKSLAESATQPAQAPAQQQPPVQG